MTKRGTDIEQAIDALYDAAPAAFTKQRDALAKRMKAERSDAAGARVMALRKPTAIAYALNQLARRYPAEVAELANVGRVLARAQRKALRGEAGHDLRDAIGKQRAVVTALTALTAAVMEQLGVGEGHLDAVAAALQSALVDPAVGKRLEEGRLEKVPETAAGFAGAWPGPVDAGAVTETRKADPSPPPRRDRAKIRERSRAREAAHAAARERAAARFQAETDRRAKMTELDARASKLEADAKVAVAAAAETSRVALAAAQAARSAVTAAKRARRRARSLP